MWIVRLALGRPYTFVVMAALIAILGGTAIVTMPVDIFPYIDIPIVSVLWTHRLQPGGDEDRPDRGPDRVDPGREPAEAGHEGQGHRALLASSPGDRPGARHPLERR
jgi:hypothetical protein